MKPQGIVDNLTESERKSLFEHSVQRTYKRKELIFHKEERLVYLFILLEGQVCVCDDSEEGTRNIMTIIQKPMDCFGEVYLFMDVPYPFYAEARQESKILLVPKSILPDYPQIAHNMNVLLASKAYTLSSKLKLLMKDSLQEKILEYLRQHPDVTLKRHELASYLGVSRPALSKALYRMVDDGLLYLDDNGDFTTVI